MVLIVGLVVVVVFLLAAFFLVYANWPELAVERGETRRGLSTAKEKPCAVATLLLPIPYEIESMRTATSTSSCTEIKGRGVLGICRSVGTGGVFLTRHLCPVCPVFVSRGRLCSRIYVLGFVLTLTV